MRRRTEEAGDGLLYRLDKIELSGTFKTVKANLVRLFGSGPEARTRRLVVELEAPRFHPAANEDTADDGPLLRTDQALNAGQREVSGIGSCCRHCRINCTKGGWGGGKERGVYFVLK